MKKHLFLIGFMGCGKTHWGKRLAAVLRAPFVDLDEWIEQGEKTSIAELFEREGESGFRQKERTYLRHLADHPPSVVATGGGTPCFGDNLASMQRQGLTVWIDVPFDILLQRLQGTAALRPLLKGADADVLWRLWTERRPYYQRADHTIRFEPEEEARFWEQLCAYACAAQ